MRQTIVPAQITTVEDRITGRLGLSQLLILVTPIFTSGIFFFLLPPVGHVITYKIALIAIAFFICPIFAIRIRGKIILFWLVILLRYNVRPRFYVFDKQTQEGRERYDFAGPIEDRHEVEAKSGYTPKPSPLPIATIVGLEKLMKNPAAHLYFESNKKGGLYVRITEIKSES